MSITRKKYFLCGGLLVCLGVTLNISIHTWSKVKRKLTASGQVSPRRGFGTHFVTISVGNPPQSFRLAVAPESDHTSLPCIGCSTCHAPQLFQYSEVSVNKCSNGCAYEAASCEAGSDAACKVIVNYSDHIDASGYTGIEITDIADISNSLSEAEQSHNSVLAFPLRFICQQENFGSVHVADGILGMSSSSMSFVNQLYEADKIDRPIFSLCFRRFDDYPDDGSSAGHVTFGHVDRNALNSPLIWADNQVYPESHGNYAVHVRRIYMGKGVASNEMLTAFSMGTLSSMPIDGGSSGEAADYSNMDGTFGVTPIQTNEVITYLHTGVEAAFKSAFKYLTEKDYVTPFFDLTQEEYLRLPTIFIQVESKQAELGESVIGDVVTGLVGHHHDPDRPFDVVIAIPPENYIVYKEGRAYPTVYFEQNPRIASNILQNYEIVFDISRQRIGLAQRYICPPGMSINGLEACTEENKTCGDGSIVGRDPSNNCEFKVCADGRTAAGAGQQIISTARNDGPIGHGSNMEFDGQGASNSASGYSPGRTVGNNANSIHSAIGGETVNSMDKEQPLPPAEGGVYQALFIGPGAKQAQHALKPDLYTTSSEHAESVGWSAFGFFLFFFSFFLTAVFTHDNIGGYYSQIFRKKEDDTDEAMNAWQKGKSFYNQPEKKQDSFNWKRSNKNGFFGVGDNASMSSLGVTKTLRDSPNYDQSTKGSADRPYYDRSIKESADLPYYEKSIKGSDDRPKFEKSLSGGSDKSYGFLGVLKPGQSSHPTGAKKISDRRYYETSTKDLKTDQDPWQKPVYKKLDPLELPSVSSKESSVQYPQKPDLSKFVKPVNSGDRQRFSESSVSGSSFRSSASSYTTGSSFYGVAKPEQPYAKQLDDDEYSSAYSYRSSGEASKSSRSQQQETAQQYEDDYSTDEYSYDSRYEKGVPQPPPQQYGDERSTSTYTYGASTYSRNDDVSKPSMQSSIQQKQIPQQHGDDYSTSYSTGTYTYGSSAGNFSKPSKSAYEQYLEKKGLPQHGDDQSVAHSTSTYTYGDSSDDVSKYSAGTYAYGPQKPAVKTLDDGSYSGAYSYKSGDDQSQYTSEQEDLYNPQKPSNQNQADEYSERMEDSFVSEGDLYNPAKPSTEFQDEYDDHDDAESYGDYHSFYGEE
mmetsp:Transcript_5884/g.9258  ORF Transcript_5884/g.9258 Transcript_5884/m.9258 type:complete len:1147 (+) Transcript_5884:123-3563(+)